MRNRGAHRAIPLILEGEAEEKNKGRQVKLDSAWVRQQLTENSAFRQALGKDAQENPFSGQAWREEDSPGNWAIRETAAGTEYLWYDIEGGEHAVPLFRPKSEP
jgi:hypothetical protein